MNAAALEKAATTSQLAESSTTASTSVPSLAPSEEGMSNGTSAPSSASSTPRFRASPPRRPSVDASARVEQSFSRESRQCCKPALIRRESPPTERPKNGSCCGSKGKRVSHEAPPGKSCCSSSHFDDQPEETGWTNVQQDPFATLSVNNQILSNRPPVADHAAFSPMEDIAPGAPPFRGNIIAHPGMVTHFPPGTPIYNHTSLAYYHCPSLLQSAPNTAGHTNAEHSCHCGDTCACFGCAAHPHNSTMTEYLRLMDQYMRTGAMGVGPVPMYDAPSYLHHPAYASQGLQQMAFEPSPPPRAQHSTGHTPYSTHNDMVMGVHHQASAGNMWPSAPLSGLGPTPALDRLRLDTSGSSALKQEKSTVAAAHPAGLVQESPTDIHGSEDAPTLSPSTYIWQELVLPGCSDETGTCQCGEGCDCVGCLTHGGHTGIALDRTVSTGSNDFEPVLDHGGSTNGYPHLGPGAQGEALA